jgi:lipopolysaccharide biosynthesis glycosyltransferase
MSMLYACYASSDFYARETGISMLGFFDNNPDYEPDTIIILDYGILENNKEKLNGIAAKYGKHIDYVDAKSIMDKVQKDLNLTDFRGSLATYSRAFIDKLVPDYVERLLYIDSDTVVVGSINALNDINMHDKCMAGIIHTGFYDGYHNAELSLLSGNTKYFGCGVVYYEIQNWRKLRCYEMIASTLGKKNDYPYADQSLINNAIPEKYLQKLPLQFNYTSHIYNANWEIKLLLQGGWYTKDEAQYAIDHPVVVHYPGSPINRPWYNGCLSHRKGDYEKYKEESPWCTDELYSLDEYVNKNKGLGGKYGVFLHRLKATSNHYEVYRFMFDLYASLGKIKYIVKGK